LSISKKQKRSPSLNQDSKEKRGSVSRELGINARVGVRGVGWRDQDFAGKRSKVRGGSRENPKGTGEQALFERKLEHPAGIREKTKDLDGGPPETERGKKYGCLENGGRYA